MCLLRVFRFFSLFGKKCFHNIYINYQITLHAKLTTSTHTRSLTRLEILQSRDRDSHMWKRDMVAMAVACAPLMPRARACASVRCHFVYNLSINYACWFFLLVWKKNEIIYMRSKYQSMAEEEGGGGKRGKKFENVCFVQHRSRWNIFGFSI